MVMLQGVETKMISIPAPPAPTDLSQFKLSSPPHPQSKSPDRDSSLSPASSPPSLAPSGVSMVSMASMLSRPPSFGFPGLPFPQGFSPKDFSRPGGPGAEYPSMLMGHNRSQYARSPPPMVSPNDPTANDCKIVEYRGEKIAAFMINGKTMLCLPQAFELFLKNLVGGLHTVYTKCKRLDVHPMICNVEQVRVLRGLGAIQPGVNRCKLIADSDFDQLYKDCTTSRNQCYTSPAYKIQKINGLNNEQGAFDPMPSMRPGRPPKRVLPFPAPSPQDAMLQLNRSPLVPQDNFSRRTLEDLDGGRFPGGPGGGSFPGGHPMTAAGAAHLMSLNNPAALLSRTGMLPGMPGGLGALPGLPPLHGGPGHALLETYKQQYGDFVKHLQGLHKSQDDQEHEDDLEKESDRDTDGSHRPRNGSVLNLSAQAQSDLQEGSASSDPGRASDSDIGEPEADIGSEAEDMDISKQEEREAGAPGPMFQMMNQIQSLIKMSVEKMKHEEKNNSSQKCDLKDELDKEKESQTAIKRKIEEETKTTDLYLKRFRKERKLRKQLEDQLEMETKKIQALEAALRSLSYDTLVQVKETIAREAASREIRKTGDSVKDDREAGGSDSEMMERSGGGHYDSAPPPGYPVTTASAAASLAQLNYNISQMTSSPAIREREAHSPGPVYSLASSLPPSVSSSSF